MAYSSYMSLTDCHLFLFMCCSLFSSRFWQIQFKKVKKIMWIELSHPENPPTHDIQEPWTAVSTLLDLISCTYHNLHHWRLNQRLQIAVSKLYHWATSSYLTQVMPNQLVRVIVQPNLWSLVRSPVVEITVYTADES